jgi:hypothetical protein
MDINLPPMERRLQQRYLRMVHQHMKSANTNAAGPSLLSGENQAAAATQATWRFLNNANVLLTDLIEPLRQVGREAANASDSSYALLAHDWCKIDYKNHSSKQDLRQITHQHDIGYEMTTSLLIDAATGDAVAPMQMHLKTGQAVHSTAAEIPDLDAHRLDQVTPTMREAEQWGLERKIVHVIDREADTLGRMRQWDAAGYLFLVRCDDRRVKWNGRSILISELADHFDSEVLFESCGEALYHGKAVSQEVVQTEVILHRPHSEVVDGEKRTVTAKPLSVRLVITRLIDDEGFIVAHWTLLCNVSDAGVSAYQIALWYYWRWLIETFFKLLKSHGQELEQWQQQDGEAIAKRILVASMACVVVLGLQRDDSPEATRTKKILVKLSGRQMKYGVLSTAPALLAGYMSLLSVNDLLTQTDVDIGELKRIARKTLSLKLV